MDDILSIYPETIKGTIESITLVEPADEIFKIELSSGKFLKIKETDWLIYYNAKEGDCVLVDEISGIISLDEEATNLKKAEVVTLQQSVFK